MTAPPHLWGQPQRLPLVAGDWGEYWAARLIRQGAPTGSGQASLLDALASAAPFVPDMEATLTASEHGVRLSAWVTELAHEDLRPFLGALHRAQPGAGAWFLSQLDLAFGGTCPFSTPHWMRRASESMRQRSPRQRQRAFRERERLSVSVRTSERLIHHQGYPTTYTVEWAFGKGLLPERACRDAWGWAVLEYAWPEVAQVLREALGECCAELPPLYTSPAFVLATRRTSDIGEAQDPVATLVEELGQHYRYGVTTAEAEVRDARALRRAYRALGAGGTLARALIVRVT